VPTTTSPPVAEQRLTVDTPEAALAGAGALLFLLVATTTVQDARDVRGDLDAGVRTVGEVVSPRGVRALAPIRVASQSAPS